MKTANTFDLSASSVFTVSFWYKTSSYKDRILLESSTNSNSNSGAFFIDPSDGTAFGSCAANQFELMVQTNGGDGQAVRMIRFAAPSANAWHQYTIVATSAGSTGWAAFVDGSAASTTQCNGSNVLTNNMGNYTLYGMTRGGTTGFNQGDLADVAVWTGTLIQSDAQNIYNGILPSSIGGTGKNLILYDAICGFQNPEPDRTGNGYNFQISGTGPASSPSAVKDCIAGLQVSSRSDTLSDSRLSATSNHTVTFTTRTSIYGSSISGSSTLAIVFPDQFTFPANLDCGDVDVATGTQFLFNYPSCYQTSTAWGFVATGSVVLLVPPTGTGEYVASGTPITISIGANATFQRQGAHWITNPATGGTYTISVGGTFGGSGNMLVSINSGVTVAANVAESLSLTVSPTASSIKFLQGNFNTDTVANPIVTFSSNNTASSLIILAMDWNSQSVTVNSISDTNGNTYVSAVGPVNGAGGLGSWRDQLFYAKNIKAGANTVTVHFSGAITSELYAHEYSGADLSSPLDVTASSTGNSATPGSGSKTTNFPNELVFGYCQDTGSTCTQGTNFATRRTDNQNLSEDMIATSTGSYSATANLGASVDWIMSMATFKPNPQCAADDGATVNQIATTATSVPFGTINANTFYQGCQDLTVSTNAGNGYSLTVQESHAMMTAGGIIIPDTTCDAGDCSVATATTWVTPTKNGLGHTCFNQAGSDCNPTYGNGKKFKPVPSIPTGTSPGQISFVQTNSRDSGAASTSNVFAFNSNSTAGNLIVVAVEWDTTTSATSSITDSRGNVYASAIGPIQKGSSILYEQIFYANNIAGGANTVTVKLTGQSASTLEVYLHEYSGADTTAPLDVTSASSSDNGTAMNSGSQTTNFANELIFGFGTAGAVSSPGAGFTSRNTLNANMTEDKQVSSAGSYNATATGNGTRWSLLMATFRASNTPVTLMSNSGPSTATGRVKYRLSASSAQPAGIYTTVITYTLTPTY